MKYVLDTNIFNQVLDGRIVLSEEFPPGSEFIATKVQLEELEKTRDQARRSALRETFQNIDKELENPIFCWDIDGAGWDNANWGNSDSEELITKLRNDLEAIKSKFNNWHDAVIAEVAWRSGHILATADQNLANIAARHGIKVCQFSH